MTPEGVNIAHPDKLYIGGEWVAGRIPGGSSKWFRPTPSR